MIKEVATPCRQALETLKNFSTRMSFKSQAIESEAYIKAQ